MSTALEPGQQSQLYDSGKDSSNESLQSRTRTKGSHHGNSSSQWIFSLMTLMEGGDLEDHLRLPPPESESNSEGPQLDTNIEKGQHHGSHNRIYIPWFRLWKWELAAMIFSVACLTAVSAILFIAQKKTLSEWKFSIRPNALVAVFNTLSGSAMLSVIAECVGQLKWTYFQQKSRRMLDFQIFDLASRGSLGSFQLLAVIHRRALVASVFALLTIFSLAMDPFAQQILHFQSVNIAHQDGTASIPMAQALQTSLTSGRLGSGLLHGLKPPLQAFYSGLFASESQTSFICTSGNCTWPAFQTMGMCSDCTNVTNSVQATYSLQRDNTSASELFAEFITPKGLKLHYSYDYSESEPNAQLMSAARHANECSPTNQDGSCYMSPIEIAIGRLSFDYFSDLPLNDKGEVETAKLVSPPIYECNIHYCESTRSVQVNNGKLYDTVIKTIPLSFSRNTPQHCNDNCDSRSEPTLPNGRHYTLGYMNARYISAMLLKFFSQPVTDLLPGQVYTSTMASLWWRHDGNIPSTVQDITDGLTTYIRQGPNKTELAGTAMVPEIVINVEWPWFILPVLLVLLTTTLLGITIIASAKNNTLIWKSSTLAPLFHGLHNRNTKNLSLGRLDEMELIAGEMWVRLSEDENGNPLLHEAQRQGVKMTMTVAS